MEKSQKKQFVSAVKQSLEGSKSLIITHYHGLTVEDLTSLRKQMRAVGVNYKIVKNSLAKLAIVGTEYEKLSEKFVGPIAIAVSQDPLASIKVLLAFAKTKDSLKIIGGMVEKQIVNEDDIKILSTIPSLDELRGKIIGLLNAPASKLVGILQAPGGQLARVIGAHASRTE